MKIDILLKQPLKNPIVIDKIGMTIRPLTNEEKNDVIGKANSLYFSDKAKRRIKKYIEYKGNNYKNFKSFEKYDNSLTKEERTANFMYSENLKKGSQYLKTNFNKILKRTAVVELTEKIDDFIDNKYSNYFINMVMRFLIYIKSDMKADELSKKTISADDFSIFNNNDIISFSSRLFNFISSKEEPVLMELNLSENDFEKFKCFIMTLTKERIRDFNIIFETLFNTNNILENKIVSLTSIIERLLIKHDTNYDIGKQFTLKFGLILKENTDYFTQEGVNQLNYCYAIRSCIVHGDDKKIADLPKKYYKVTDKELDELLKADTHYSKRNRSLILCILFIEKNIKIPLRVWVNNTEKIEFLKNN